MTAILTFAMLKENPVIGDVCLAIIEERERQVRKWGPPKDLPSDRTPADWLAILMEEVGELSEAVVELRAGGGSVWQEQLDKEMIHVAAVAVSWQEWIEFQKGSK